MALAAGTRLGPYEIVAPLGAGGMGEVYRARDTRLDRSVAIKILPPAIADSAEHRARFEREARAIAALNHPHICTLHDVGEANGATFLVMEHVAGETLAQRLKKGPVPLDQTLRIGIDIADALQAAHRQGIVHRDLKPGNVMLTTGGAKLLDFGLARLTAPNERAAVAGLETTTEERLTGRGLIVGTLPYMAPEQVEGREADARTDLWALGAILYEMLTGRAAFEGASSASLIGAILEREPAPVCTSQPLTPPGLDRLVRKCLAKQPDARWQSAADVADELRWIASGSGAGVVARPSRRIWRRWLPLLAVGVLVVGSLIGLGVRSRLRAVPAPPVIRSVIKLEPGSSLDGRRAPAPWGFNQPTRTAMVLASNGRFVVYSAVQQSKNDLSGWFAEKIGGVKPEPRLIKAPENPVEVK
jgi:serine/threonine protein kinase